MSAMLFADGIGTHMPKGYIYAAMIFALGLEISNMRARKRSRRNKPPKDAVSTEGPP